MPAKGRTGKATALAVVAIWAGLALLVCFTRSVAVNRFVTWDEPAWVYRSVKFLLALRRGDLAGTLLTGHPGVLTMWSGALSLAWQQLAGGAVTQAQLAAVDALPGLDVQDPETIRQLAALLPAAKAGIVFLHVAVIVLLFWLLTRLLGRRDALLGGLLLALDPYYLALSRVLHTDALAAGFMLVSFLSILVYARHGARRYLLLSGLSAGLAMLSKTYAAFLIPAAALLLLAMHARGAPTPPLSALRRLLRALRAGALWAVAAAAAVTALWPAMWASPAGTLQAMLGLSIASATNAGDATSTFFLGHVVTHPGPAFYPVVMLFRTTPLVLVGAALAMVGLPASLRRRHGMAADSRPFLTAAMLAYVALFVAAITLSNKMYDRYLLPALLGVDVLAALGWAQALDTLAWAMRAQGARRISVRAAGGGLVLLAALLQANELRPLYPGYYLAYYNPLAGGPGKAVETIPVGWGEGVEQAAAYLASKPYAAQLSVATWTMPGCAPFFPGQVYELTAESMPDADYVLLYMGDVQAGTGMNLYGRQQPEFVAEVGGIEYAWVYSNARYEEQLANDIAAAARPGDVIVSNRPAAFDRHYSGGLPHTVVGGASEEDVAAQLDRATQGAGQVFYVEYEAADGAQREAMRRHLAQDAVLLWEEPFAYGTLGCYWRPGSARTGEAWRAMAVDFSLFRLEGYRLSSAHVKRGQALGLALQWRTLRPAAEDYHVFIHLVDEAGHIWSQGDGPLQDGELVGSSNWAVGSRHSCGYAVPVTADIPAGQYQVLLGVYSLADLSRLDIVATDGQRVGDAFEVGPVWVD